MNELTCESLIYFARFRETLLFLICIFFSWRIFECKKLLCQNCCTSFETLFVRVQKWAFSSILKFSCCTNFFLKEWWWGDWLWKGWSCLKREKKGYNAKQHVTICLRVLRRIDGAYLMEGKKAGFGLRLALLYHLELLLGKVAKLLLLD